MFIVKCKTCKKDFAINVSDEQIARWNAGGLIQNVMPEVPKDLRELLINGICGACFDALFSDDAGTEIEWHGVDQS